MKKIFVWHTIKNELQLLTKGGGRMRRSVSEIVAQMTLKEKASMCSGKDFWRLESVRRLGVPQVMVADGPHGLRKQAGEADHLGINDSIPAVCFPTACASAASFDRNLLRQLGEALGQECQAEGPIPDRRAGGQPCGGRAELERGRLPEAFCRQQPGISPAGGFVAGG